VAGGALSVATRPAAGAAATAPRTARTNAVDVASRRGMPRENSHGARKLR
jgi:hypothetical protein